MSKVRDNMLEIIIHCNKINETERTLAFANYFTQAQS